MQPFCTTSSTAHRKWGKQMPSPVVQVGSTPRDHREESDTEGSGERELGHGNTSDMMRVAYCCRVLLDGSWPLGAHVVVSSSSKWLLESAGDAAGRQGGRAEASRGYGVKRVRDPVPTPSAPSQVQERPGMTEPHRPLVRYDYCTSVLCITTHAGSTPPVLKHRSL